MSKIEKFIKTAGIYFFGNAFTKIISFLLLPLYTNRIAPTDFGTFGLVQSLSNLIIPLVFFQIWDSVFRFAFDYEDDEDKYKVISNGFVVMLLGLFVYFIGFIIISCIYDFDHKVLVFSYALGIGIQYFYSVIARAFQKNSLFVISGCINSALMIILNVVLIIIFKQGIESLYISSIIGVLVQIIIIEIAMKPIKKVRWKYIKRQNIIELIKFSAPVSLTTTSQWLLNGLTQLVISIYVGTYENGLFTVANKFSSMLTLLVGVFQFAWNEMAYILSSSKEKKEYYERSITEILKVTILGSSIFLLFIKIVFPFFIDKQYHEAIQIVPIVLIGTSVNSYTGFLGTIFLANKNSNKLFSSTIIASITNVICLMVLTPMFELKGATMSLCIAFTIGAISRIIMLNNSEGIKIDRKTYNLLFLLMSAVIAFYTIENIYLLIGILIIFSIISYIVLRPLVFMVLQIRKKKLKI